MRCGHAWPTVRDVDTLHATLDAYIEAVTRSPHRIRAYYALLREANGPVPALHDHVAALQRDERQSIAAHIATGQRAGTIRADLDPDSEAALFLGVLRGVTIQWLLDPEHVDIVSVLSEYGATLTEHWEFDMADHDLVIREGHGRRRHGRAAAHAPTSPIDDGVITEVGRVDGTGAREIDADGALVTPGFVDIHTHYDGQATWDQRLPPSSWHGVTTVVMGNCGVGFAPVRPSRPRPRSSS